MRYFIRYLFTPDFNDPEYVFMIMFVSVLVFSILGLWFFN